MGVERGGGWRKEIELSFSQICKLPECVIWIRIKPWNCKKAQVINIWSRRAQPCYNIYRSVYGLPPLLVPLHWYWIQEVTSPDITWMTRAKLLWAVPGLHWLPRTNRHFTCNSELLKEKVAFYTHVFFSILCSLAKISWTCGLIIEYCDIYKRILEGFWLRRIGSHIENTSIGCFL